MLKEKIACALIIFTISMTATAELLPFLASGKITAIDTGEVVPAGISGRFVVKERHIEGVLDNGDLSGDFLMTYHANVPITTQSGNFGGTIAVASYTLHFEATSSLGLTPSQCAVADYVGCFPAPDGNNYYAGLLFSGSYAFADQNPVQGFGLLNGWVVPNIDNQGHIIGIVDSAISLTGQWSQ